MTEELIDLRIIVQGHEPILLTSDLDNPVLEQLCWALANRDQLGSRLMYLELQDADLPNIYFPASSLVSIESDQPLPESLFEGANAARLEDYLHLNMDRRWIEWAIENLRRGEDKPSTYRAMRDAGVDRDAIRELLGYAPSDDEGPIPVAERETILPLRAPDQLQVHRIDSELLEIYLVPGFLAPDLCQQFIHSIGDTNPRSRVFGKETYYEGRTSDTRFFTSHDQALTIVRDLQDRVAGMFGLDVNCLEHLHCNTYAEGQQFRAHTDYFREETSGFIGRDGVRRHGQRQWSVAIYLSQLSEGSGIRFPRLDMELDPEQGSAVIWNNLYPSGNPNPYSLHEGRRVVSGTKYMLAQFTRVI